MIKSVHVCAIYECVRVCVCAREFIFVCVCVRLHTIHLSVFMCVRVHT